MWVDDAGVAFLAVLGSVCFGEQNSGCELGDIYCNDVDVLRRRLVGLNIIFVHIAQGDVWLAILMIGHSEALRKFKLIGLEF